VTARKNRYILLFLLHLLPDLGWNIGLAYHFSNIILVLSVDSNRQNTWELAIVWKFVL